MFKLLSTYVLILRIIHLFFGGVGVGGLGGWGVGGLGGWGIGAGTAIHGTENSVNNNNNNNIRKKSKIVSTNLKTTFHSEIKKPCKWTSILTQFWAKYDTTKTARKCCVRFLFSSVLFSFSFFAHTTFLFSTEKHANMR